MSGGPEAVPVFARVGQQPQAVMQGARSEVLWIPLPGHLLSAARDGGRTGVGIWVGITNPLQSSAAPPDPWAWANRNKVWMEAPPPEDKGNNPDCQVAGLESTGQP